MAHRAPDALDVVCPQCRAQVGDACVGQVEPHRPRALASLALAKMPEARRVESPEERAARAARERQRARARDPRWEKGG